MSFIQNSKFKIKELLRKSERFTKTDMVYLAKGSFWWIFGRIVLSLLALAVMMAFARWLPKETFGAYQYILSIVAILAIFSLPGIDTALVRVVAKGGEKILWLCAKTKFRWALISAMGCFAIAGWYLIHQNFILGISFLIAGFFFPFVSAFNLFVPFWQGKKRFDIQAKYQILLKFLSVLVLLPIIFFFNNLILIILAFSVSSALFGALFFKLTLKKITTQDSINEKQEDKKQENPVRKDGVLNPALSLSSPQRVELSNGGKETISYGKHLTLMSALVYFSAHLDKIIIWQLLGPIPVAIYAFARLPLQKIQEIIPIIPLAFPKLSEKNVKKIKKEVFKKFLKLFLFSIPLTILAILLAPYFYKFLFPVYLESVPYFQVLALGLVFVPFSLLGISLLTEMKKKALYIISFTTPLLQIVLFLILIPFFGIWGIIFAILLAQFFNSLLILYFFKKI